MVCYDSDIYDHYNHDYDAIGDFDIYGILKRHIDKMKTAKLFVSEENLRLVRSNVKMHDFQKECEEEIASMKIEKIIVKLMSHFMTS